MIILQCASPICARLVCLWPSCLKIWCSIRNQSKIIKNNHFYASIYLYRWNTLYNPQCNTFLLIWTNCFHKNLECNSSKSSEWNTYHRNQFQAWWCNSDLKICSQWFSLQRFLGFKVLRGHSNKMWHFLNLFQIPIPPPLCHLVTLFCTSPSWFVTWHWKKCVLNI